MTLANKYRPHNFDQIIGQERTVQTVKALIKEKKILSRSIFLYGPTGVGKTTLARILAHHVNCENYNYDLCEVCGTCNYCEAVANTRTLPGVEELNFSETRGIDTVRSVIDSLDYVPLYRARVVILDEMHNMTKAATDAFLKISEEPPENTLFILITMNPHQVSRPIRDRCTRLEFNRIPDTLLENHLRLVSKEEEVVVPEYTLKYLVHSVSGILRDALNSLETIITLLKENPNIDLSNHHILEDNISNANPKSLASFLIGGIYAGSYGKSLSVLQEISQQASFNPRVFIDKIYEYHLQTFYLFIDPKRILKNLSHDFYGDWYETLINQAKKKNALNLTVASGELLFDLLLEASDKLKGFETDTVKLLTTYTVRMVRTIKENAQDAYTAKSPFHKTYSGDLA